MTLRTKPIITLRVIKKPDGRMVLTYTRTPAPPSSQKRGDESSTVTSTEESATLADMAPTSRDGESDGQIEAKPCVGQIAVNSLGHPSLT